MTDVAVVTCRRMPEPDFDEPLLMGALAAAGLEAELWAWDDPAVDWSGARLALVRSTWDYPLRHPQFLAWAERTARLTRLWNPLEVVRWNSHKGYLLDLERAGVPVAPTALLRARAQAKLATVMDARGWDRVVVKPAVSAGSVDTIRVDREELETGEAHLGRLLADRDALVQPYLKSVDDYGERALVWIDGELTHAVRKSPRFAGDDESVTGPLPITDAEAALAQRALEIAAAPLLYARIDVAPGDDGEPVVMELELIEPSLFLKQHPPALDRLVDAVRSRLSK